MLDPKEKSPCEIDLASMPEVDCSPCRPQEHHFKDGKYYRNQKYFGDVIYCDENVIQIECRNGNKFMEGQIITMKISSIK